MQDDTQPAVGSVVSLWRYPVKSMLGEALSEADITLRGMCGDREYALIDASDGKVASAKNPRKWPALFRFRAAFALPPTAEGPMLPVNISLPDGTLISSQHHDVNQVISAALGREVILTSRTPARKEVAAATAADSWQPSLEEYWPDMEGLSHRDTVTDEAIPEGSFFDLATIHLLTTSTLMRLKDLYPAGRFDLRRFRPNIVLALDEDAHHFAENQWIGKTIVIGTQVRIAVTRPCQRCLMTTLPQDDLPQDTEILRTAAAHNNVSVGVYGTILQGGAIRTGDRIEVE